MVEEMPVKDDGGTVNSQKNPGRKHFWELSALQGLAYAGFTGSVFKFQVVLGLWLALNKLVGVWSSVPLL